VRQQGREGREEHDVERDDRAQEQDETAHLSTVSSGFRLYFVAPGTIFR
jgi:hypothetical protein